MHNTLKYNILCRRGPRRFIIGLFGWVMHTEGGFRRARYANFDL